MIKKVRVVPCSGIGKVYGLIAREAVLKSVIELCPDKAETVCLAYIVTGDQEIKEKIRDCDCITLDGCSKMCASKNVSIAGGKVVREMKVIDTVKELKGKKIGTASRLDSDGEEVVNKIAVKIEKFINEII
ncbi:MAG: putative zinc-binding protein [Bacteroidales bacterium]